ncbi:MAG TPA: Stf0 family sulfotransferase [Stellaceae bacterium]|nr:Stf0 family sulfotransferase [Stellaceae bacterium]
MGGPTKFVIVAGPRTGSTFLVDYLDRVPGTRCWSELFRNDHIDLRRHRPSDPRLQDIAFRDAQPAEFVRRLAADAKDCRAFGFKLIGHQIPKLGSQLIQEIFGGPDWRKIYLWREDLFEQSVSYALAAKHFGEGVWERTPDEFRIRISPKQLLECLHVVQTTYFIIESVLANCDGTDLLALNYDELGHAPSIRRLLRFLGLPKAPAGRTIADAPRSGLDFKPGPPLAARIENYDEIRRFFLNSRYRRLLRHSMPATAGAAAYPFANRIRG